MICKKNFEKMQLISIIKKIVAFLNFFICNEILNNIFCKFLLLIIYVKCTCYNLMQKQVTNDTKMHRF